MNWSVQVLNGLSFGLLLFLVAAGLSLTFGVMRVLNLTHGSFFLIGGYLGWALTGAGWGFVVAAVVAFAVAAALGFAEQRFLLWKVRHDELSQVLLTVGLVFVIADIAEWWWGADPKRILAPEVLRRSVELGGSVFPVYRLFVIVFGVVAVVGLWLLLDRTRLGALVRAGVDDDELVQLHGVGLSRLFGGVFAIGTGVAGLAGVIGGPILGVGPGADFEVLTLALVVVVVGGLGSIQGALVGALFVGLVDSFGKAIFPDLAQFTIYAPMVAILALRPQGLIGAR